MHFELGKPSKLEHGKTWEKFPTGGGGVRKNSQSSQVSLGKFFRIGGGGQELSQSSQVHKKGGQKGLKTLIRPYIFRKIFTKFPSLEKGGGQDSSHCSQVHKVPNLHRGGGSAEVGNFSQVFPVFNFEGFP